MVSRRERPETEDGLELKSCGAETPLEVWIGGEASENPAHPECEYMRTRNGKIS
jgi:hypothetical protein